MKFLKKYSLVIVLVFGISMFLNPAISMMIMGSPALCIGVSAVLFVIRIQDKGVQGIGKILAYGVAGRGYKIPVL